MLALLQIDEQASRTPPLRRGSTMLIANVDNEELQHLDTDIVNKVVEPRHRKMLKGL